MNTTTTTSAQSTVRSPQSPTQDSGRKTQDSAFPRRQPPLLTPIGNLIYPRLDQIKPSSTNPRRTFGADELDDLAASIQSRGVIEPIIVRPLPTQDPRLRTQDPQFEIVAGERRWRASKLAGKETIPATVRELDDKAVAEIQLIENGQRADLNPYEEACGFQRLIKQHGYTVDQVATALGKQKRTVYARLQLCRLSPPVVTALEAGKLDASRGLLLARIPDAKQQAKAMKEIIEGNWDSPLSTREAEEHIQREYMADLRQVPFKLDDAALLPSAGACTTCPKNLRNQSAATDSGRKTQDSGLSPAPRPADRCTDPACCRSKTEAWNAAHPPPPPKPADLKAMIEERTQRREEKAKAKAEQQNRDAAYALRQQVADTAIAQIVARVDKVQSLPFPVMRLLVKQFDGSACLFPNKNVQRRRGWPEIGWIKQVETLDKIQLAGMLIELLANTGDNCNDTAATPYGYQPNFLTLCKLYKVDLKKLEKQAEKPKTQDSGLRTQDSLCASLHAGTVGLSLPPGVTAIRAHVKGNGVAHVLVKDADTLKGGGPYTKVELGTVKFDGKGRPNWKTFEKAKLNPPTADKKLKP